MRSLLNYLTPIGYNSKDKYLYYFYESNISIRLYTIKRRHRRAYLYRESFSWHNSTEFFFRSFREGYEELIKDAFKKSRKTGIINYA